MRRVVDMPETDYRKLRNRKVENRVILVIGLIYGIVFSAVFMMGPYRAVESYQMKALLIILQLALPFMLGIIGAKLIIMLKMSPFIRIITGIAAGILAGTISPGINLAVREIIQGRAEKIGTGFLLGIAYGFIPALFTSIAGFIVIMFIRHRTK